MQLNYMYKKIEFNQLIKNKKLLIAKQNLLNIFKIFNKKKIKNSFNATNDEINIKNIGIRNN